MKKIICVILILIMSAISLCGCAGEQMETMEKTKFQLLLNNGGCFAYVFADDETGVWYVSSGDGVTPRLNSDGSLYVTEY